MSHHRRLFTSTRNRDHERRTPRAPRRDPADNDLSRRAFVALSIGSGLAAATAFGRRGAARRRKRPRDRRRRTAAATPPSSILERCPSRRAIWPDAFGLRPAMREMGCALPARLSRCSCPIPSTASPRRRSTRRRRIVDFSAPETRAKLGPLMGSINAPGAAEKDAAVYVAFLDAQRQVDRARRIGTQGYCMGGALVMRTAAAVPDRIGAGASFHGGGLVTDRADSPHLLAPRIRARMYIGVAATTISASPRRRTSCAPPSPPERSRRDRGLSGAPRLVRPRHADRGRRADLQPCRCRARLGQAARPLPVGARPADPRRWATVSSRPRLTSSRRSGASRRVTFAEAERLYRASLALVPGRASTLINLAAVQLRLAAWATRCRAPMQRSPPSPAAPMPCFIAPPRSPASAVPRKRWRPSAPARERSAPCRSVERQRHPAARNASARRGRACVPRGAAPWRGRGSARVLPRLGRGRRAPATAPPPTSPASSTAMPTSSTATSSARCATRRTASWSITWSRPAAAGTRFRSALDLGCGTGLCGPLVRPMVDRLTGVDLSARMIEKARSLGVYDRLEQGDIVEFLDAPSECAISCSPPTSSSTSATSSRSSPASGVR